jgi:RNA polymerase sigma-70 factor (ECF subfamily)
LSKRITTPATRRDSIAGTACEQYHVDLQRFLTRRLRSAQQAQDLAQEAYLRLLRVERIELIRKPKAYLYRIAVNLISEFRLREQREPVTFDSDALDQAALTASDAPADEQGERTANEQQIETLLEQLPPLYRAIFVLRKRDGLSYQEIAQQLEISAHTVKKYLARAVALCRHARWPD